MPEAPPPYTTKELLHVLSKVAVDRQRIAVVHYGERNQELTCALERRGGCLDEFCLYEWLMPEDQRPLDALVDDVIEGRVDAIAFTSQMCRHLFAIAERGGRLAELRAALQTRLIVAAMGPVCEAALRSHGVIPDVLPSQPRMGSLVTALADYVELRDDSGD